MKLLCIVICAVVVVLNWIEWVQVGFILTCFDRSSGLFLEV